MSKLVKEVKAFEDVDGELHHSEALAYQASCIAQFRFDFPGLTDELIDAMVCHRVDLLRRLQNLKDWMYEHPRGHDMWNEGIEIDDE